MCVEERGLHTQYNADVEVTGQPWVSVFTSPLVFRQCLSVFTAVYARLAGSFLVSTSRLPIGLQMCVELHPASAWALGSKARFSHMLHKHFYLLSYVSRHSRILHFGEHPPGRFQTTALL